MAIAAQATALSVQAANGSTSISGNVTIPADPNCLIIAAVQFYNGDGLDHNAGCTYGGNAMTLLAQNNIQAGNQRVYFFYYMAGTGNNTSTAVTHSTDGTTSQFGLYRLIVASYSGVSQTGFPDAQSNGTTSGNGNVTGTLTTSADNSWAAMIVLSDDDNSATAGSGTTIRVSSSGGTNPNRLSISDGNSAKTPAGSYSLIVTPSTLTSVTAWLMASFAPAGAAGGATRDARALTLLGVG